MSGEFQSKMATLKFSKSTSSHGHNETVVIHGATLLQRNPEN